MLTDHSLHHHIRCRIIDKSEFYTDDAAPPPHSEDEEQRHSELFAKLTEIKQRIDIAPYQEHWEEYKRLLSVYELVHVSRNVARRMENIALYVPLSRSYFTDPA